MSSQVEVSELGKLLRSIGDSGGSGEQMQLHVEVNSQKTQKDRENSNILRNELLIHGRISGQKTSKSWVFWVDRVYSIANKDLERHGVRVA